MTISVIIPVYNVENYLAKCLDSVINQTYQDLEIICINDGSTDNSPKILDEYLKKDKRIKLINQENQGLSGARNTGLKNAKGEYISFIDSDDWIDQNYFEKLFDAITKTNSDIALSSILRVRKNLSTYRVKYEKEEVFQDFIEKIKIINIPKCCYVWNKLYKRDLIINEFFPVKRYYEDVFWTPYIIKKSEKIVTVPDINYYYRANKKSIVKQKQSQKKQSDSYLAKKNMVEFLQANGVKLTKKEKTLTKEIKYFLNFQVLKIKEFEQKRTYYLLGFIPIFKKKINAPIIKENTFLVWEPCSVSHSEVVPGYVKYLLDMNYHVSVLVHPERYKEGLFSRFGNENITYNKISQKDIRKYFLENDLKNVKGVLVTTVGKICDDIHFDEAYSHFHPDVDKKKLFFVEHEASFAVDKNMWREDLITLRKLNYKGAKSVVVNPHYFGEVKINDKNKEITNFITIGAIRPNKKDSQMIINAAKTLYDKGYRNFKITVVGKKGKLKDLDKNLRKFFDIKGRLPFDKMYDEIEKADFILTAYNEKDPEHIRYNTSGTSGAFQLMYGFVKPCIITKGFACTNELDENSAILHNSPEDYYLAMEKGINMSGEDYKKMQNNLSSVKDMIYKTSYINFEKLINGHNNTIEG